MIQSMTGYGAAQHVEGGVSYVLEVRSLNNRYLKVLIKLPEHLQFLESEVDRMVRSRLGRGSITYALRVRMGGEAGARPINLAALQRYVDQIGRVRLGDEVKATVDLGSCAMLPGVCEQPELDEETQQSQRDIVAKITTSAIDTLVEMRCREGEMIRTELHGGCEAIRTRLADVAERAPKVVEDYHEKLKSRVATLMQSGGFELDADGLMREVAIYAERCDITEEVARLGSHLDQFEQLCDRSEQVGRTLDFLTQELLREANTIASKSNDAPIARSVVEIKGLIDRLKEQGLNVE